MEHRELQLVSYEQARRLKKLGYDWCNYATIWYKHNGMTDIEEYVDAEDCYAPAIALALKWLRDVKGALCEGGYYIPNKTYRFFNDSIMDGRTTSTTLTKKPRVRCLMRY